MGRAAGESRLKVPIPFRGLFDYNLSIEQFDTNVKKNHGTFRYFFEKVSDNRLMTITGLTIQEIADKLKIPYKTAHKRLETAGIKPILKEDLYPESALEVIRNVRMGRPPKQPEAPGKPAKPAKK